MSASFQNQVLIGLTSWLQSLPSLAGFTITDRPAGPATIPDVRLGPITAEPWNTGSSTGSKVTITATILTQLGSFSLLNTAVTAICQGFESATLGLTAGTSVVQRVDGAKTDHDPAQNVERATLTLSLLLDHGDAT